MQLLRIKRAFEDCEVTYVTTRPSGSAHKHRHALSPPFGHLSRPDAFVLRIETFRCRRRSAMWSSGDIDIPRRQEALAS
jgi:hypothetical protein